MANPATRSDRAIERLDALLHEAISQPTSGPYRAELINHVATARQKQAREMREHAHLDPRIAASAERIDDAANGMLAAASKIRSHGSYDTVKAWLEHKRASPWWRRMWMPIEPPLQFSDEWVRRERHRAQADVTLALSGI